MFKVFWEDRKRIFIATVLGLLTISLTIIPFDFFGDIVDGIANKSLNNSEIFKMLIYIVVTGIGLYLVKSITDYYISINYFVVIGKMQEKILRKVLKQTPAYFKNMSIGEIITRINTDTIDYVAPLFTHGYNSFVNGFIGVIFIWVYIWVKTDFMTALLVNIVYILVTIFILSRFNGYLPTYNKMVEYSDSISEETLESIKGVRIVRVFDLFTKIRSKYIVNLEGFTKYNYKLVMRRVFAHALNILSAGASYFFLIFYGYYQYARGNFSFGALLAVSLVISKLPWFYTLVGEFVIILSEYKSGITRVYDVLDSDDVLSGLDNTKELKFSDKIEFRNFTFKYEDGISGLENISFSLNKGQTLGIVGKTGSGKTTLVKQLLRLYDIKDGIYIDGVNISNYNIKSLRDNFGYCPQEYFLFSQTLRENVIFNRPLEHKLEEALILADVKKDVDGFKEGIETIIGENGISLSGGQKQRISIARAIISDPEILILDDSLSALDIKTEGNIIKNIEEFRKGKTNVIVSHRISSVINADKIIVLSEGKIENIGTHNELLEKSNWYRALYEYQMNSGDENEKQ